MAVIVFLGNCQAQALCNVYGRFVAPWTHDNFHFVDAYKTSTKEGAAYLEEADVLISQTSDFRPQICADDLVGIKRRIRVPIVSAGFLWPFAGRAHPRTKSLPFLRSGPYPRELGDAKLNKMCRAGLSAEEAIREYLAINVGDVVNLDRLLEMNLEKQRRADEATGFNSEAIIKKYFRKEHIFLTPFHPNVRVFRYLAIETFRQMGISSQLVDRIESCLAETPFPKSALPIHPEVVRHFGLKFVTPGYRYNFLHEGTFTIEEFIGRYINYQWNEPLERGIAEATVGDLGNAAKSLQDGLRTSPGSAEGWRALSTVSDRMGLNGDAIKNARLALGCDPENARCLCQLGNLLSRSGAAMEAENLIRQALKHRPGDTGCHRALVNCLVRAKRFDDALRAADTVLTLAPNDARIAVLRGEILEKLNRFGEAREALNAATKKYPKIATSHLSLSQFLSRQGDHEGAIESARSASNLAPNEARFHVHFANLLLKAGQLYEAEQTLRMAVQFEPRNRAAKKALCKTYIRLKKIQEGLDTAKALSADQPIDAESLALEGLLQALSGNLKEAETRLQDALRVDPSNTYANNQLAWILGKSGRVEDALVFARRAVEGSKYRNPDLVARLGRLLISKGELFQAEECIRQGIRHGGHVAVLYKILGGILGRQGRNAEAAESLLLGTKPEVQRTVMS